MGPYKPLRFLNHRAKRPISAETYGPGLPPRVGEIGEAQIWKQEFHLLFFGGESGRSGGNWGRGGACLHFGEGRFVIRPVVGIVASALREVCGGVPCPHRWHWRCYASSFLITEHPTIKIFHCELK